MMEHQNSQLQAYVTVHAYKQLWMYPWGYKKGNIESRANAETAQAAVEAINSYVHANQYQHGSAANLLYPISGSSNDYVYGDLAIPYSFSLELRDRGNRGFLLPKYLIEPTAEEASVGLFAMAREILKHI